MKTALFIYFVLIIFFWLANYALVSAVVDARPAGEHFVAP